MKVNSQEEVREMQVRLLTELEAHINQAMDLKISLYESRAFLFLDLAFCGIRQLLFNELRRGISAIDVIKIEVSIFDFLAKKGLEVYAYAEYPDRPYYAIFGESFYEAEWQESWDFENHTAKSLWFWLNSVSFGQNEIVPNKDGSYTVGKRRIVRYEIKG